MAHSGEIHHDLQQPDHIRLTVAILASAVIIFLSVWGCYLFYVGTLSDEVRLKESGPAPMAIRELRVTETAELTRLQWVDQAKGQVKIPIDMAMDAVVKKYNAQ